jgi:hypothetical protein
LGQGKDDSVFLWLLEQERQNNRERALRETNRNSVVQSPGIPCSPPAIRENDHEDEGVQSPSGEKTDLELLFKEKAGLEEESRLLDEEQKRLNLRVKTLIGKLVQETKKRNSEKQQEIIHLREQIGGLENQLGLEKLVQGAKMRNGEKQQENVDLRRTIGMLEAQLGGLSVTDVSGEGKAEKIDNSPHTPPSEASQEELLDSDQNVTVVEIIEEIR